MFCLFVRRDYDISYFYVIRFFVIVVNISVLSNYRERVFRGVWLEKLRFSLNFKGELSKK